MEPILCEHREPEGLCAACLMASRPTESPRTINRVWKGAGGAVIETRGRHCRPARSSDGGPGFGGQGALRDLNAGQDRISRKDRLAGDSVRQHGLTSKGVGPAAKAARQSSP